MLEKKGNINSKDNKGRSMLQCGKKTKKNIFM